MGEGCAWRRRPSSASTLLSLLSHSFSTSICSLAPQPSRLPNPAGQKGSDASAREATRKMVSGAKQLEALQAVIRRVTDTGDYNGIVMVHQAPPGGSGGGALAGGSGGVVGGGAVGGAAAVGGGDGGRELPPVQVVAHPEVLAAGAAAWMPKNTIVRGVFRDMSGAGAGGAGRGGAAQHEQQQRRKGA